jgi:hypothetical protein
VWERRSDIVLAAHHTGVKCGVTTTLETVRFERRTGSTSASCAGPRRTWSSIANEAERRTRTQPLPLVTRQMYVRCRQAWTYH